MFLNEKHGFLPVFFYAKTTPFVYAKVVALDKILKI